nr:hypothetical protein [Candidatus Njordarchaeum guaymaensis]
MSESTVDRNTPRTYESSGKTMHKVVVIKVRRTGSWGVGHLESCEERREYLEGDLDSEVGRVLGSRIVDIKEGLVVFWILSMGNRNTLGFEASYLQGAVAAVVVLESSDRETVHGATELLRTICKSFSIPVMLVVGGKVSEGPIGFGLTPEFASIASKVVSFAQVGRQIIRGS